MKRYRGGLVCKAHRLVYHSTLGSRVIKKKKCGRGEDGAGWGAEQRSRRAALTATQAGGSEGICCITLSTLEGVTSHLAPVRGSERGVAVYPSSRENAQRIPACTWRALREPAAPLYPLPTISLTRGAPVSSPNYSFPDYSAVPLYPLPTMPLYPLPSPTLSKRRAGRDGHGPGGRDPHARGSTHPVQECVCHTQSAAYPQTAL